MSENKLRKFINKQTPPLTGKQTFTTYRFVRQQGKVHRKIIQGHHRKATYYNISKWFNI
jgi:2-phosphoglycerate kinase